MRPLPKGLRLCETCGEARGTTTRGYVSACYCSGVECTWCGEVIRRPISDYYGLRDRTWWHVPYFNQMGHGCKAPAERRIGKQWKTRTPDPDVKAYQDAVTELAWAELEERQRGRS